MSDLETILQTTLDWAAAGKQFALATVVGVRGSTYRGLGARQLVAADGYSVGTVSGGCLDQDLHRVVQEVISSGRPRLVEFDLTADDEAIWGWGIGCNGATELLVVPASHAGQWAKEVSSSRVERAPLAVVHDLFGPRFARLYVRSDGPSGDSEADSSLDSETIAIARDALDRGESTVAGLESRRYLVEVLGAPPRLLICGAGHDSDPLAQYASELGFEVVVTDERPGLLDPPRFPSAQVVTSLPAELRDNIEVDQRTYAVIMSHNYLRDLDYLKSLLGTEVAYLGALGPGARLARLVADLQEAGIQPSAEDLSKMHGPAGLDIGAEGPKEIAWAIMAEILAVRRTKGAGFLRDRKGQVAAG